MLLTLAVNLKGLNIADIVVVAILVLGLIVGVIRGFSNTIGGGAGSLLAILLGVIGIVVLKGYAEELPVYLQLKNAIYNQIIRMGAGVTYPARIEDGKILVLIGEEWVRFTGAFTGTSAVIANIAEKILVNQIPEQLDGTTTVATIATARLANIVLMIIIFIIVSIVAKILLTVFSKLIGKIVKDKPVFVGIDRVVGLIFSVVMVSAVIFGVFYYISSNHDNAKFATVVQTIEQSHIAKWIYYNNPIIKIIA